MVPRPRLAGGVFVVLVVLAAVLSFADRAPGIVFPAVASLGGIVEGATGIELLGRGGLPVELDAVGHAVLWGSLAAASWWRFGGRVRAIAQGLVLFAASGAVEVGQMYLTSSRILDPADVVANAVGIAGGLGLARAIDTAARALRRLRLTRTADQDELRRQPLRG